MKAIRERGGGGSTAFWTILKKSLSARQGIPEGMLLLFETVLDKSCQIFEDVPDGKKGEANK